MGHPSRASEFPNDNAEISGGAIWLCQQLLGPPTAQLPPKAAITEVGPEAFEPVASESFVLYFDDEEPFVEGPVDIDVDRDGGTEAEAELEAHSETETHSGTEADAEEAREELSPAFVHFEAALTEALMAQGATRSAALVPRLLRLEPLPADALSKDVQLTLQSRGYLDGNARYSPKYRGLCGAWTAVLRGSSQDFGPCGTTTLDRFGADLLAALLAVPATRSDELRRGLRKAGIAAFGVLEAA